MSLNPFPSPSTTSTNIVSWGVIVVVDAPERFRRVTDAIDGRSAGWMCRGA
jgi:hypothetical protein